ncbi:hypothetical protein MU1_06000 [Paenibacillus glycanilyticus]|uniref:Uncharacterized protein n=1 Tax=Paenibacillus glycanilyticus TaxID=126569 RepID=A0ABQ6G5L2_9BACL|nr:hypothetical protein MU1_06000 [Paenibacillus glycanilyticus]
MPPYLHRRDKICGNLSNCTKSSESNRPVIRYTGEEHPKREAMDNDEAGND